MDLGDLRSSRDELLLTVRLGELELEIKRQQYQAQLLCLRAVEVKAEKEVALWKSS